MIVMDDWSNIAYLQSGTPRQQDAWRVLVESDIFMVLASYDAVLVGAIPLGLDTMLSEVEIICHTPDLEVLAHELRMYYGDASFFELVHLDDSVPPTLICRLGHKNFTLEIRAQPIPVAEQVAMRLLEVEARLLRHASHDAHRGIQARMDAGQSLHAAFTEYFQLSPAKLAGLQVGADRHQSDRKKGEEALPNLQDLAPLLALESASYRDLDAVVVAAAHNREPYLLAP